MKTSIHHKSGMTAILAAAAAFIAASFAGQSYAQGMTDSYLEWQARMQAGPDEYLFFEDDRKQVVSYSQERIVRVCAGESSIVTPLSIEYDDKETLVMPGDCIRVEAMEVYLEPADTLEPNTFLRVQVDTLS
ncbi:hypothetical protein QGM61_03165 [Pseudohongiella sp. SYSU M77423]|uniref:hypothetical protein n=1 Tax=Pseudohongiella sp. SYSU M77423 TaxID=3042312 RepID=UPI0024812593|nr:hypothetical protein [Pseudohongiella sp. SYSU M77423]MDH7942810.1 hypothetical protein [Pseudohongiella sp. SYSU M77423]